MIKKPIKSIASTFFLFLSCLCLIYSGIGVARASLQYFSEDYKAKMNLSKIGVSLMENGEEVSWRTYEKDGDWNENVGKLLTGIDPASFEIGKHYKEELAVKNTGNIHEYVRVAIYCCWKEDKDSKNAELSAKHICLEPNPSEDWLEDTSSRTDERRVYYYRKSLAPGEVTPSLTKTFFIDSSIQNSIKQEKTKEKNTTTITNTYLYNDKEFCVEARVDAVQEHNISDAILSAWGPVIQEKDGILYLEK